MTNIDFIYEATFNKCNALNIPMEEKFIDEVCSCSDLSKYTIDQLESNITSEIIQLSLDATERWYKAKKKEVYSKSENIVAAYMELCGAYDYDIIQTIQLTKKSSIHEIMEFGPDGPGKSTYKLFQIKNKLFTEDGELVN